jgi:8-oxo-dGTP pyrophosphatase MutT (NUDIX family)
MAKTRDDKTRRSRGSSAGLRGQPPSLQVAALCWRRTSKGVLVVLITSRDTGRWVIPKGWPMRNRSEAEAAEREAWEEAGLRGHLAERSIGLYTYRKVLGAGRAIPCVVRVFPLEVQERLKKYPETGQRRIKWFSPKKAASKVEEADLARLLRDFDPDRGG